MNQKGTIYALKHIPDLLKNNYGNFLIPFLKFIIKA